MEVISAEAVAERLDYPRLIDSLAAHIGGPVKAPPRHLHALGEGRDSLLIMPAWDDDRWIGVKLTGVFPDNPAHGGAIRATSYVLIDRHSGLTVAVLDGKELTNRRTAAASALAARALAREDARTLLVMGTGSLAPYMAQAHAAVRRYDHILVWGRDAQRAQTTVDHLIAMDLPAALARDAAIAVAQADVVTCATSSPAPVLLGQWVRPGTHIDLVGAYHPERREADSDAVAGAILYADVRANVLREAGDIILPIAEGRITADAIRGELRDLVAASPADTRTDSDITLFKSVGFAAEDLIAARTAMAR